MIAKVIVDRSTKYLDKPLFYSIPDKFRGIIEKGMRVKTKLNNREIMGIIVGFANENQVPKNLNLEDIVDLIDLERVFTDELLDLTHHIKKNGNSTYIDVILCMVPSSLKIRYEKRLNILNEKEVLDIIDYIKNKTIDFNKLESVVLNKIKKHLKLGNIELELNLKKKANLIYKKIITLNNHNKESKSKPIIRILEYLKIHKSEELSKLRNITKTTTKQIESLLLDNSIKISQEVDFREAKNVFDNIKKDIVLNNEQKNVVNEVELNKNEIVLLHGITGSGKTEVYINLIDKIIKNNKEAILLVPEIGLTSSMIRRFKGHFGDLVSVLHSKLSDGQKHDEHRKILRKKTKICIGTRSAIFAPFENLGIIIVDESHDDSYIQDTRPIYNAIDVAKIRCQTYNIPLLLGTATPRVTRYKKALDNEYKLLKLENRANNKKPPEVFITDMKEELKKGNFGIFSNLLINKIKDRIQKNEKIILFVNRRGHSSFLLCKGCGDVVMCPNCDISLTYHNSNNTLNCHYCNYEAKMVEVCPSCFSEDIKLFGIGTQQIEEKLLEIFPDIKLRRMDNDTTTRKNSHEKILNDFEGDVDVLIGTQMVTKGLDIKGVTLVGIVAADLSLYIPNYDASEKTFSTLNQVAGRSGRHDKQGEVVLQTYNKDHYSIKAVKKNSYENFYNREIIYRKIGNYPPYKDIYMFEISSNYENSVQRESVNLHNFIKRNISKDSKIITQEVIDTFKVKNIYSSTIIIKSKNDIKLDNIVKKINNDYENKYVKINIKKMNF